MYRKRVMMMLVVIVFPLKCYLRPSPIPRLPVYITTSPSYRVKLKIGNGDENGQISTR
jgi:hypothetical protein